MHISTPETHLVDAAEGMGDCPVCLEECTQRVGYNGSHCAGCNSYYHLEPPSIFQCRRKHLGMTRREFADALNLLPSTVANYERNWPSKSAYVNSEVLVLRVLGGDKS